jgi:hypothetical protein
MSRKFIAESVPAILNVVWTEKSPGAAKPTPAPAWPRPETGHIVSSRRLLRRGSTSQEEGTQVGECPSFALPVISLLTGLVRAFGLKSRGIWRLFITHD